MRRLMFHGPDDVTWVDVAPPVLLDDRDALVRPLAVARCDLDRYIVTGAYPIRPPFALGHEMVGEVIDAGDRAGAVWRPGDRVVVPFQVSCGECATCSRGWSNACESVPPGSAFGLGPHGGVDFDGCLADVVRVPYADRLLLAVPDGMTPRVACGVADNIVDGYRTVAGPLQDAPGAAVLVVGGLAASVGLYAVAAAGALGASHVSYVDDDDERVQLAASLGATAERVELDRFGAHDPGRFEVTVDASILDEGRDLAIRSTAPNGTCTSVGAGRPGAAPVPLQVMYMKGIRYLIGRVHARAVAPDVLALIADGRLQVESVTSRILPFEDAAEAMFDPDIKVVFEVRS